MKALDRLLELCYTSAILKGVECFTEYMSGSWDDSLKLLINDNPQAFVNWLFEGARVLKKLQTEFKTHTIIADALLEVSWYDEIFLLHIEFQSTNDSKMGERLLEYNLAAHKEHDLEVLSIVIYLKSDGEVPQSPLRWRIPTGKETLQFHYLVVEMAKLATDQLRHEGLIGILPLLLLTKDGATHEVVNEVITGLQAADKYDLLPITELLASLVLKDQADQEWIKRRFAMLQDALRETPAYQRILQEGREEGREEEREALQKELRQQQEALQQQQGVLQQQQEALQKVLQQQQEALQKQRDILLDLMIDRFPLLARRTKDYAKGVDDLSKLSLLIVDMAKASTAEEAERILRDVEKGDKETN
jgi:predicted transposase YdaD